MKPSYCPDITQKQTDEDVRDAVDVLARHVALPQDAALAATVFGERIGQLYRRGLRLVDGHLPEGPPAQIVGAVGNLGRMAGLRQEEGAA